MPGSLTCKDVRPQVTAVRWKVVIWSRAERWVSRVFCLKVNLTVYRLEKLTLHERTLYDKGVDSGFCCGLTVLLGAAGGKQHDFRCAPGYLADCPGQRDTIHDGHFE